MTRWIWLSIACVAVVVEMSVMSFDFLAIGLAAAVLAIVTGIWPEMVLLWQIVIFAVLTMTLLILSRTVLRPLFHREGDVDPMGTDMMIWLTSKVVDLDGKLVISHDGRYWTIENPADITADQTVIIASLRDGWVVVK